MPRVIIDGKEVEVPGGTSIIEAAKKAGSTIPHYCYHPGLSVAGNCRMCLVEIEKYPKLQISCYTPVAEGMVVHTKSDKVKNAQQSVLEFLLVSHPLDCPVCDQSGECELQNYYMDFGLYESRLQEDKLKKAKAVPIGPTVMLDQERCILCSRCVRFTDEISKTHELGIVNRGDHGAIVVQEGRELDNKYSGNVVDICPVGALTDREFRFKCRVWYLETSPSICTGCSRGCNIDIHWNKVRPYQTPGERVMRIKPRFNEEVNKWWICDEGRYGFGFIDQFRIRTPFVKDENDRKSISWKEALKGVSASFSQASETAVILSTDLTNESAWIARRLFVDLLKVKRVNFLNKRKPGYQDQFLMNSDKSPNTKGLQALGFQGGIQPILNEIEMGQIRILWVFGHDLSLLLGASEAAKLRSRLEKIIYIGSNDVDFAHQADWILPASVYAEKNGTFVNFQGRVQRIFQALMPFGESLDEWEILENLAQEGGFGLHHLDSASIFQEITEKVPSFSDLSYESLALSGKMMKETTGEMLSHVG